MTELTPESIQYLSQRFGLTEDEILERSDKLINVIRNAYNQIKKEVLSAWNKVKPYLSYIAYLDRKHKSEFNQKFFNKKKSQKRNWKKWKKRRRQPH
ncbi:hypothetical protein ACUXCC_003458 [Cytobacillus horneckiae]|uniref:hypothetical protein n=1 Tax=Cytobacillus horneckiae TaxID=549687 RepID=UPI0019D2963B|nr:hypothetical protein [Cytobacillus horneckiae]MBN6889918.1 hypothetical protein [Cytobacillus horneckiae]